MLECKSIKLFYRNQSILNDVSLEFHTGLTCIFGPNGAGKSTLIKTLSGQVENYQGVILFNNQDISKMSIYERSKAFIFMNQSYEVTFNFTVEEVLKMGFHGLVFDNEIYQKAIEMLDISHFLHRNYQTLSGGEQQRVQFARAIVRLYATHSNILFLDEPSSSADIKQELNMIKIAKKIANDGKHVIMISHNISIARKYGDYNILLKDGSVQKYAQEISGEDIAKCFDIEHELVHTLNDII